MFSTYKQINRGREKKMCWICVIERCQQFYIILTTTTTTTTEMRKKKHAPKFYPTYLFLSLNYNLWCGHKLASYLCIFVNVNNYGQFHNKLTSISMKWKCMFTLLSISVPWIESYISNSNNRTFDWMTGIFFFMILSRCFTKTLVEYPFFSLFFIIPIPTRTDTHFDCHMGSV